MLEHKTLDYFIRCTWLSISKMYNEEAAKYNSTMVTGFVLLSIDPKHGTSSTSLGPKMGIESTSLSRTLKNLEEKGLIIRTKNPLDKRGVIIKLTDLGIKMRNVSKETVLGFNSKVEEVLTKNEYNALINILNKVYSITKEKEFISTEDE